MKSNRKIECLFIFLFCIFQIALSQTIEDLKLQIMSGKITPEEALKKVEDLEKLQRERQPYEYGIPVKKVEPRQPIFIQDYLKKKEILESDSLILLKEYEIDSLLLEKIAIKDRDKLKYFGYDIFRQFPENFLYLQIGPVDPNYVIGPGDEIILSMWGDTELRYSLTVERDGTIYIERVGQVVVNGYTVASLSKRLEKVLSKFYSTIKPVRGKPTTFIDISLGKLRPVLIYVIGEVIQPGAYPVNAFSTVFGALLISGGPSYQGSLRNIQVIRDDKVAATFDLYRFLTTGKKEGDIRLRNDDIVYVPYRSSTVYLKGEVKTPAIFELNQSETLADIIHFSSGLNTKADLNRVQVERIKPFGERKDFASDNIIILDRKLGEYINGSFEINKEELLDQDIVTIFPIYDELKNYVIIDGAVHQPGKYSFEKIKTVEKLIEEAQGLLPEAYKRQVHITRTYPDYNNELITLDISKKEELKTKLMDWDSVKVYSIWDIKPTDLVRISGEVRNTGKYALFDGTTLKDVIIQAGGFKKTAYEHEIEVFRVDPAKASPDKLASAYRVKITGNILDSKLDDKNFSLRDNDEVVVRSIPFFKYQQNITLLGEVKFPGFYTILRKDETLKDVVKRAGGLTSEAFPDGIIFTRGKQKLIADFEAIFKGKSREDIVLRAEDRIEIPIHPQTVEVLGLVNNPGLQKFKRGLSVKNYIESAGGYHKDADKGEVYVYYANGEAKKYRRIFSPKVTEGVKIIVGRKEEREPLDTTELLKEVASITASMMTILILVRSIK